MALKVSVLLLITIATNGRRNARKNGKLRASQVGEVESSFGTGDGVVDEKVGLVQRPKKDCSSATTSTSCASCVGLGYVWTGSACQAMKFGFAIGDEVFWTGNDSDNRTGTEGIVVGFTSKRITIKFPSGEEDVRPKQIFKVPGMWVKGDNGQKCDDVCQAAGGTCNSKKPTTLTSEEAVKDAFLLAEYACKSYHAPRNYSGGPFSKGTDEGDCAPWSGSGTFSCTANSYHHHAPLCYCDLQVPGMWVKGGNGEKCRDVCIAAGGTCNRQKPTTLTSEEAVKDAFLHAGYKCRSFHAPSNDPGAPFSKGTNEDDCAPWRGGRASSCINNAKQHHAPLCYCNIQQEKCLKKIQLSPAPEADIEVVKDLFRPLLKGQEKMGSGFDVQDARNEYNDLKIQGVWKVDDNRSYMLKKYISDVNFLNINKSLGQQPPAKTPRPEFQTRAKELNKLGENEYLLWKGSKNTKDLQNSLCIRKKLSTTVLKSIFGVGRYFSDASDKADQYNFATSKESEFEHLFDIIGREDTCLKKLQGNAEHQNNTFFVGLYRVYLGKYYEVGFEKVGGLTHYNSLPLDQREHRWHYRDPTNGNETIIDEKGNSFNRTPPFDDWNALKVMSKTFEPNFSKDWRHHPFPTRYNEYVLHNNTPWALQYVVAYRRGRTGDADSMECRGMKRG